MQVVQSTVSQSQAGALRPPGGRPHNSGEAACPGRCCFVMSLDAPDAPTGLNPTTLGLPRCQGISKKPFLLRTTWVSSFMQCLQFNGSLLDCAGTRKVWQPVGPHRQAPRTRGKVINAFMLAVLPQDALLCEARGLMYRHLLLWSYVCHL
jgi:hypothetical protein